MYKIGLAQTNIVANKRKKSVKKDNILFLYSMLEAMLKDNDVDLIVLPEEFIAGSGYSFINMPETFESFETIFLAEFRQFLKERQINAIVNATLIKDNVSGNYSFILNRNGETVAVQGRKNLYRNEPPHVQESELVGYVKLDIGNVLVVNSLDFFDDKIIDEYVTPDVNLLISPMAFAISDSDYSKYMQSMIYSTAVSRATRKRIAVICVNPVGTSPHFGGKWFGNSMFVSAMGNVQALDENSDYLVVGYDKNESEGANDIFNPIFNWENVWSLEIKRSGYFVWFEEINALSSKADIQVMNRTKAVSTRCKEALLLDIRGKLSYRDGMYQGHLERIVMFFYLGYPLLLYICAVWGKKLSITLVPFIDRYQYGEGNV